MSIWYLSFADDDGFRGAVMVAQSSDIFEATLESHHYQVNPGGSVFGLQLTDEEFVTAEGVPEELYRLYTEAELEIAGPVMTLREIMDEEEQEY